VYKKPKAAVAMAAVQSNGRNAPSSPGPVLERFIEPVEPANVMVCSTLLYQRQDRDPGLLFVRKFCQG
jgi:hypothetical protein